MKLFSIYSKAYDKNKSNPLFKQVVLIEDKDLDEVKKNYVVEEIKVGDNSYLEASLAEIKQKVVELENAIENKPPAQ